MDESASPVNPYAPSQAILAGPVPAASEMPVPALWNPDVAGLWSLFFTPAFGSFLILKNWQVIRDRHRIRMAWTWLVASALFALSFPLAPRLSLPYLILWYFAWQRPQAQYVTRRWGKIYPHKRWGLPILLAVVWVFVIGSVTVLMESMLRGR